MNVWEPKRSLLTLTAAAGKLVDGSHDTLDGVLRFQSAFNLLKTYSRARRR